MQRLATRGTFQLGQSISRSCCLGRAGAGRFTHSNAGGEDDHVSKPENNNDTSPREKKPLENEPTLSKKKPVENELTLSEKKPLESEPTSSRKKSVQNEPNWQPIDYTPPPRPVPDLAGINSILQSAQNAVQKAFQARNSECIPNYLQRKNALLLPSDDKNIVTPENYDHIVSNPNYPRLVAKVDPSDPNTIYHPSESVICYETGGRGPRRGLYGTCEIVPKEWMVRCKSLGLLREKCRAFSLLTATFVVSSHTRNRDI